MRTQLKDSRFLLLAVSFDSVSTLWKIGTESSRICLVLFASYAGVPNATINGIGLWYTVSRLVYGAAYIFIESEQLSIVRTAIWWSCNMSCITGLVMAGRAL